MSNMTVEGHSVLPQEKGPFNRSMFKQRLWNHLLNISLWITFWSTCMVSTMLTSYVPLFRAIWQLTFCTLKTDKHITSLLQLSCAKHEMQKTRRQREKKRMPSSKRLQRRTWGMVLETLINGDEVIHLQYWTDNKPCAQYWMSIYYSRILPYYH